jgi:RHS repeat-associated protein
LTENSYNELSQLTNKKVGNNLQSIDYAYNIRGWMTKINDPANLSGKLFGYEMKYQNPQTNGWIPRYNGNISEIDWKSSQDDVLRRYNYEYDPLNRLVGGYYLEPNSSIVWVGYFHEYYNYDLNGNITRLVRMGKPVAPQTTAQQIDELIYTYAGNRLNTVTDISQNPSGYPLGGSTIYYDKNGNMTNHLDKGISSIQHNYLNLPKQVTSSQGNISYIYRADGGKVKKTFGSKITDYLDGFQYEDAVPKFLPTSEGYFNFENNKYIYNYTDHLGNIRLSYFNNGSGAEVLEENNYYPFGLKHEGYNALSGNPAYKYQYNGKELQENGMYDYGARFYMPDLGRWGVVDPLAEKMTRYSPYNYAYNNPISFIDPDGRQGEDWVRKDGKWQYDASVTTVEQAQKIKGVDGFAKNGTVLSDAKIGADGESGYVRLNDGGSAEYLPEGASNALVAFSNSMPMFAGGTWTTWTQETFQIFLGGANETDPETMKKVLPGDKIETNDMFQMIFSFYGRNTKLSGGTTGFQEALVQFGIDIESLGNPFNLKNDSITLTEQIFKSPYSYPEDTIKMTTPKSKYDDSVRFHNAVKTVNDRNTINFYNRTNFLGKSNWK